jgi:hypothetical protein
MSNEVGIKTVELERISFTLNQVIAPELAKQFVNPAKIRTMMDPMTQQMVITIQQDILGRATRQIYTEYPADWWQAVKERFAPHWFLRRWPIRYTKIELHADELYPKIALPKESHALRLSVRENGLEKR